jgi:hypothetical protein
MSENPFVNQLGDALEDAFAAEARPKLRRGLGWRRPSIIIAVAVVVVGCAAVAAKTLLSPTTAAIYAVQCVAGTTLDDPIVSSPNGGTVTAPVRLCAHDLGLPASRLVACARARDSFIFVFHAAGAHQCTRLGLELVPHSYRVAQLRIQRLGRAFAALNASAYCIAPSRFEAEGTRILHRLGWKGWSMFAGNTPADEVGLIGGGDCASVSAEAFNALDPISHTVSYDLGPPPALEKRVLSLNDELQRYSASRCLSRSALEAYSSRLLESHHLASAFAYRSGASLIYGQGRYDRGCPVVWVAKTSAGNLALVDVLVFQRDAPPMAEGGLPPQSVFNRP